MPSRNMIILRLQQAIATLAGTRLGADVHVWRGVQAAKASAYGSNAYNNKYNNAHGAE